MAEKTWLIDDESGLTLSDGEGTHRVALVTGSARRIGAAIAEGLARSGFAVIIHGSARSGEEAQALAAHLSRDGAPVACVCADLADIEATRDLVGEAARCFGPIDVLVNNASIFVPDTIGELEAEAFDRIAAINLRAPLILSRAFAEQAVATHDPSIVNVLDQRVFAPNPLYLSYSLSKAGLASATTILAQALAPDVRVNAVAPGPVLPNAQDGDARFRAEVAQVPLGRPVSPAAIADAVRYLVTARNVTGQVIAVDSGQRLAWRTPDVLVNLGEI